MSLPALVLTLAFGVGVGVLSGLVGVGGGVLMVPFLYLLFSLASWSGAMVAPEHHAVVAHATSLFVILPTALSGLAAYRRSRLVAWELALPMSLGAVIAATVGARVAAGLPPQALKLAFGLLLLLAGGRLLIREKAREEGEGPLRGGFLSAMAAGLVVGFFSALLGVGGGIVAIPILIYGMHLAIPRVAATSIGIIVFAAAAGITAYAVTGWGVPGLPSWTLGYVFLPAGLALIPGAVVGARWGAALNQRTDAGLLRNLFAVLFLLLGVRLVLQNAGPLLG